MRKILFSMLFLAMALVSCNNDDTPSIPKKEGNVTFNVLTPQLPTRAVNITRYIMVVYTVDDPNTVLHRKEQAGGTFILSLENNTSYTCLFWADETAVDNNANGTYNTTNLKNVTLNSGKEMADAFFTRLDITTDETVFNVTLKRPIAQVNIVETDNIEENANIVITHEYYVGFNTFTSDVVEDAVVRETTITPAVTTGKLGSYYTFAPVVGMMKDFTSFYNSSVLNQIPNVPLKANFVTNINGSYAGGTQDYTFVIEIDEVWEGDDVQENLISGVGINVGTETDQKWIEVADRNAEIGGINGATEGSSSIDYGSHYGWSSADNNPEDVNRSYSACFNFGLGSETWRMPTKAEWDSIAADGNNNVTRKVEFENNVWKLYDERLEKEGDFIIFPLGGYINDGDTFITNQDNSSVYWTADVTGNVANHKNMTGGNVYSNFININHRYAVRCVRDIPTP